LVFASLLILVLVEEEGELVMGLGYLEYNDKCTDYADSDSACFAR
jgi:hypothetical protein